MLVTLCCQLALVAYHQVTTLIDLFPFNGSRNYSRNEKLAEVGVNGILMLLPPIGFRFRIQALMIFGVVYYFVLFAIELIISIVAPLHWYRPGAIDLCPILNT